MEQNQSYLATEKIGKFMGGYAVPCIISLLVGALYNQSRMPPASKAAGSIQPL